LIHAQIHFYAQEAQRAAKTASKQGTGQKQKETDEPKKTFSKIQTTGSNVTKSECVSVTGEFLLLLNVF